MVPVIRDAGRLSFSEFLDAFNDLIARARENKLTADDLQGANISLTNPGGIGTIASVPRLMKGQGTIVATGAIGYPPGLANVGAHDRRREGDDDDVDVRPSHHPGRRVRPVPAGRRASTCRASTSFYEQVFADLGATLGRGARGTRARGRRAPRVAAPAEARTAAARARGAPERGSCCRPCRPRPR